MYLSAEQVKELLSDYERNKEVREAVDDYFMENGAVLLKALRDAAENGADCWKRQMWWKWNRWI